MDDARLNRIEKAAGINKAYKYLCFIGPGGPEPEGYEVQPNAIQFGGTGADPFYLATRAELEAFGAQPDVELTIVSFVDGAPTIEYNDQEPDLGGMA